MNKEKLINKLTELLFENDRRISKENTAFKNNQFLGKVEILNELIESIKNGEFDDN